MHHIVFMRISECLQLLSYVYESLNHPQCGEKKDPKNHTATAEKSYAEDAGKPKSVQDLGDVSGDKQGNHEKTKQKKTKSWILQEATQSWRLRIKGM